MATDTYDYTSRPPEPSLIGYRVDRLEAWQAEFRASIKSIDSNLQVLADVQRRLNALEGIQDRLHSIEQELPTLKLARKWVLAAMTSGGAAVGASVLALVVR